jgi:uncharacterized membrane protein (DUF4010 family)
VFETARPFLLALAIGLLMGIERERAQGDGPKHDPLGSRTFTLIALLGAVAAHLDDRVLAAIVSVFAGGIILAGYFRTRLGEDGSGIGVTTEIAAMVAFVLGYLARAEALLSIMLAVITIVVLALKPRIHQFARAGLTRQEVTAAITFLVIAFVVLPLLPDRPVDPFGLVNPARLWLFLVLMAGISFGGYLAVRWLGPGIGLALAGLSAGFVSSTAGTLVLSRKYREGGGPAAPAAAGIVLANVASAAAQIVIVAVNYPEMVQMALPVIGAEVVTGVVMTAGALWVLGHRPPAGEFRLENPLSLRSAALLAAIVGVVLILTSVASRFYGTGGLYVTSLLGGAASAHAVTLTASTLAKNGSVGVRDAVFAIVLGFAANLAVKLPLAGWVGGRRLLIAVSPPLIAMTVAGFIAFFLMPF